jgi:hypothetical protein
MDARTGYASPMYGNVQTAPPSSCCNGSVREPTEINMYIGGILGTILLIALIVYLLRRV